MNEPDFHRFQNDDVLRAMYPSVRKCDEKECAVLKAVADLLAAPRIEWSARIGDLRKAYNGRP